LTLHGSTRPSEWFASILATPLPYVAIYYSEPLTTALSLRNAKEASVCHTDAPIAIETSACQRALPAVGECQRSSHPMATRCDLALSSVPSQYMIWTLYSSQSVSNADLEALLAPFGAERDKDGWVIPLPGGRSVILEGTHDIESIPQSLRDQAAQVLGAEPIYITAMSSEVKTSGKPTRNIRAHLRDERKLAAKASELVRHIGSAFGAGWPAVLSDDSSAPMMTPLGKL
jgi:hypothetical protein